MKGPRLDDSCPLIDSFSLLCFLYTMFTFDCISIVFSVFFYLRLCPYSPFTSNLNYELLNAPYVLFIFFPLILPAFGRAAYYLITCLRGLLDFDNFNWWWSAMLVSIFWRLHYDAKVLCSYLSTFQYIIKVFKGPDSPDSPFPISTFIFSKFGYFLPFPVFNTPFFWMIEG